MTDQTVQPILTDVLFRGPIEQVICDSSDTKRCNYFQLQLSTRLAHFEKDEISCDFAMFTPPV